MLILDRGDYAIQPLSYKICDIYMIKMQYFYTNIYIGLHYCSRSFLCQINHINYF
ncbi:protein of unknown function [Legionella fallonii LLAP-10]|uniref:Uncharacterized protein n=1 Tax=Legionella fallonii LLAP-10 TaxID=1212491 RepID=A0A098G9J9_9GAMM|nr:protein of unknown function [Legionella fallonii LLAP-10]